MKKNQTTWTDWEWTSDDGGLTQALALASRIDAPIYGKTVGEELARCSVRTTNYEDWKTVLDTLTQDPTVQDLLYDGRRFYEGPQTEHVHLEHLLFGDDLEEAFRP